MTTTEQLDAAVAVLKQARITSGSNVMQAIDAIDVILREAAKAKEYRIVLTNLANSAAGYYSDTTDTDSLVHASRVILKDDMDKAHKFLTK